MKNRFLLLPGNNTLSHVAKCLAIRDILQQRGHDVHLAVSARRQPFLRQLGIHNVHLLPDLGDRDANATPTFSWFRPQLLANCLKAETELLQALRPDRVLGIFRFTGGLSSQLAGVPYDSLVCGAMTPACNEIMGFSDGEPGADKQAAALTFFRSAIAQRLTPLLQQLGLPAIHDLWQLLEGERTFLWDTPEFQPLPLTTTYQHVGPLSWNGWPCGGFDITDLERLRSPIAFVAFGTGGVAFPLLRRLVEALWQLGYSVALGLGGQPPAAWMTPSDRLAVYDFLNSEDVLPRAALVVCHGGQMLIFEALRQRLPVMVLPMQPEQAQNGRCLERLGCGQRLLRGTVFNGNCETLTAAVTEHSIQGLADTMNAFLVQPGIERALADSAASLNRYNALDSLTAALEAAV